MTMPFVSTECEAYVEGGGVLAFQCYLPLGHDGPHAARENARSMRERAAWDTAQVQEPKLSDFQGEAQTTAQRYTEGATPAPGSPVFVSPSLVTCVPCMDGHHEACTQRAEIIAVLYDKNLDRVSFFCACFQDWSRMGLHGVNQSFVDSIGDIPSPVAPPEPIPSFSELVSRAGFPEPPSSASVGSDGLPYQPAEAPQEAPVAPEPVQVATEPTKQREGDQALPVVNDGPAVQDRVIEKVQTLEEQGAIHSDDAARVIAQIEESKRLGLQRYGTLLQTFNDRDILEDAIGETRDLIVYLTGMQAARDASREEMVGHVVRAVKAYAQDYTERMGHVPDLSLPIVAGIAVDTIFKAAGGPVLPGDNT